MASAEPVKKYDNVEVIHMLWTDDQEASENEQHLRHLWEHVYNYNVRVVTEKELKISTLDSKHTQLRSAENYLIDFQDEYDPDCDRNGDLIIVCYFGHGCVRKQRPGDPLPAVWHKKHLLASSANGEMQFDLTAVQHHLRDCVFQDVLCVFECCYAGHRPKADLEEVDPEAWYDSEGFQKTHKIETLAAGNGVVRATGCKYDFTRLLAADLEENQAPTTILSRFLAMKEKVLEARMHNHAPVEYRRELANGSIVLHPL